jgi:hypothetical protein
MRAGSEGGPRGVIILFAASSGTAVAGPKPGPRLAARVDPQAPAAPVGTLVANAGIKPPDDGLWASLSPTASALHRIACAVNRARATLCGPPPREPGSTAGGGGDRLWRQLYTTSAFSMSP